MQLRFNKQNYLGFLLIVTVIFPVLIPGYLQKAVGQEQHVRMLPAHFDFQTFPKQERQVTDEMLKLTNQQFHRHPELGLLPHNTQCNDCVELIDRRTSHSRHFIRNGSKGNHFFSQSSYYPLHFRDKDGNWRTIDYSLTPDPADVDLFTAANQIVHTKFNRKSKETIISSNGYELKYNGALKMGFSDADLKTLSSTSADYKNLTVGMHGAKAAAAWKSIDIEHIYKDGGVKTNFIVYHKLAVPAGAQWFWFEDVLHVPQGLFLEQEMDVNQPEFAERWSAKDNKGRHIFSGDQPVFFDVNGIGNKGGYQITEKSKGKYKLKVMVPVQWLTSTSNQYPLTIDPWVYGFDSIGKFVATGQQGADFNFTLASQGSCDYTLDVTVPGKSQLFDTYIDIEYKYNSGGCPFGGSVYYCKFTDISMEVVSPCNFGTGPMQCDPAVAPFIGVCTTDPNLVPGADPIQISNFLSCIAPQCPDYLLTFTLKNRVYACNDVCQSNCAQGNYFAITIEARTIEQFITADKDSVCIGEPVELTSHPSFGVPPYTYLWQPGGMTDSIITVHPTSTTFYSCRAFDQCMNFADDDLIITVKPTPDADAGDDVALCPGETETIGGNPTGPAGASVTWQAQPPQALNYLSSTNAGNPVVTPTSSAPDSIFYIVRVEDNVCFRYDTVLVQLRENPVPEILPGQQVFLCGGEGENLSTTVAYSSYEWSTSETFSTIYVTQPGTYIVTVVDQFNCTGTSDPIEVLQLQPVPFDAEPDAKIEVGSSITLFATIDLTTQADSFFWETDPSLSCFDCVRPVATPSESNNYVLHVHSNGCWETDTVRILVVHPNSYHIPTAFSPNEDGFNDRFFLIKESGVTVREFKVYNRWGELVHDEPNPWRGFHRERKADQGVYVFFFIIELNDGTVVRETGNVTLIR